MRFSNTMFLALTMFAITATIQIKPSTSANHEENVVRTTYAKLSFADEIRIILNATKKADQKTDEGIIDKELASRLDFQLSNFKSGPVSEIEGRIISELTSEPEAGSTSGVISATPSVYNFTDNKGVPAGSTGPTEWALYADVEWDKSPFRRGPDDGWPMEAILKLPEMAGPYDRYATYTVTAMFQGKSITYSTAALFGKNLDGTEKVHFLDLITTTMTLDLMARTEMSTAPFSKTHLRDIPFIHKWLNNNQQACSVRGHGDVCCNPETKRCGVGRPMARNRTHPFLVEAGLSYVLPWPLNLYGSRHNTN